MTGDDRPRREVHRLEERARELVDRMRAVIIDDHASVAHAVHDEMLSEV